MTISRFLAAGLLLPALSLLLSSCDCVRDWLDADKPPPDTQIAHPPVTPKSLTRSEAVSLVCNKLIMAFSIRYSEKPSLSCRESDSMARCVASLLRKSNVISPYPRENHVCRIESVPSEAGIWHVVVTHLPDKKKILDLSIPIHPDDAK